jgi:hypothetical protein
MNGETCLRKEGQVQAIQNARDASVQQVMTNRNKLEPRFSRTVTNARYSDTLRNELAPAIRTEQRGRLSEGVCFPLARQCSTTHYSLPILGKPFENGNLKFSTIQHTVRSVLQRGTLRGRRFSDDAGVKKMVHD